MYKITKYSAKSRQICIALSLMILCSLQGCKYYYKVQTVSPVAQKEVETFTSDHKYIILHQRDNAWHLSQPMISENTLYASLSELPGNRYKFQTTKPKGGNRYIKNTESYVLQEVHLYIADSADTVKSYIGSVQIPLSEFQHAEVYVKDKGRTNASWLVPGIGGAVLGGCLIGGTIFVISSMNFKISISH